MAVDDANIVDIISDDRNGCVVLTISDHLDWSDPLFHLHTLQEKLNRYLAFVESGELLERRPEAAGRPVRICVALSHSPIAIGREFLEKAKAIVENSGVDFSYRVFPMFDVPADAPTIDADRVQRFLDEEGII